MSEKLVLDLPVLLPDALDGRDQCVAPADRDAGRAPRAWTRSTWWTPPTVRRRACACTTTRRLTNVARIRGLAEAAGATLTEQFRHVLWTVTGINHIRKARTVAEALRRLDGVVEAEVTPGLVRVEFDRADVDDQQLREVLNQHGVDVQQSGAETRRPRPRRGRTRPRWSVRGAQRADLRDHVGRRVVDGLRARADHRRQRRRSSPRCSSSPGSSAATSRCARRSRASATAGSRSTS